MISFLFGKMNIIITGASRGIGASLTKAFAAEGDHRIFIMSRNAENLNVVASECKELNPKAEVIPVVADLTVSSDLKSAVNKILASATAVDILINNAGYALRKPFDEFSDEEAELLMNTNFLSPAKLIKLLLPALLKSGDAHVVNISSMSGYQGSRKFSGMTFYGASKAALGVLTETLSEEYRGRGVSFNCLAIGAVQTEMFAEVFAGYEAPVSPEKIAEFIVEFALHAHHCLQGKIIPVSLSDP